METSFGVVVVQPVWRLNIDQAWEVMGVEYLDLQLVGVRRTFEEEEGEGDWNLASEGAGAVHWTLAVADFCQALVAKEVAVDCQQQDHPQQELLCHIFGLIGGGVCHIP